MRTAVNTSSPVSNARPAQAEAHLETLRAAIEEYRMLLRQGGRKGGKSARRGRASKNPRHKSLAVTISIGYAERDPARKRPPAVIKAADQALYRAKQQGRNRISR